MHFDWEPYLTVAAIGLVFAGLEVRIPARRPPAFTWRRYLTDLLHVAVGSLAIRLGATATIAFIVVGAGMLGGGANLPLWLQVPVVFLLSDLMFWIAHRLCHAIPWLWEFHRIHHSSEHLDWLAAYRVHPVDQIFNSTLIALPALLLGFSPFAILIYGVIYQWHANLLHSNVGLDLGPLARIITGPRFHHWHHADQPEAYDRNFGGQLVIWDRLFGTAFESGTSRPDRYGIDNPPRENFIVHLVAPFVRRPFPWQT